MADVVRITYQADLADLKKQLASIPGMTAAQAKEAVAALQKQIAASEQAARSAANAAKGAKSFEQAVGKSKEAVAQLGSAVAVLDPRLGSLVNQASALTGGLKATAAAAGMSASAIAPIGIALAAVGLAVAAYMQEAKLATAETMALGGSIDGTSLALDKMDEAAKRGKDALAKFYDSAKKVSTELAIMRGEMSQLEADTKNAEQAIADEMSPAFVAASQRLVTLTDQLDKARKQQVLYSDAVLAGSDEYAFQAEQAERQVKALEGQVEAAQANIETLRTHRIEAQADAATLLELQDQERQEEEARRRGEAATRAATAAQREATAADKERARTIEQLGRSIDAYWQQQDDAGWAVTMAWLDDQIAAAEEVVRHQEAVRESILASTSTALGSLGDLAQAAAERTAEGSAAVSIRWFRFYQAAAIAQATMNGAVAVTKAFADLGPIAGAIAAAATAITLASQIATITGQEPPAYHSGGIVRPDERTAVLRQNEGVLTFQGVQQVGGREGVERANRGQSAPAAAVPVIFRLRHRVIDAWVRDSLRNPASPLSRAVRR